MFRQVLPSILVILFFFIALFLYTHLSGPIPFSLNSVTTTKTDTFMVTGEGKSSAIPDLASVNVGITTTGTSIKAAQDQINLVSKKITDAVKSLGVDDSSIQTENYSVNPSYDYTNGSQKITGYGANTTLSVKVKDLDKINQVIDAATQNGANQVNQVTFEVSDKTKAENEAREKAVADAKKKAENAASIGGFKLGKLVNYQENFGGGAPIPYAAVAKEALGADRAATPPTQVQPGSAEITVSITLSYEIQ